MNKLVTFFLTSVFLLLSGTISHAQNPVKVSLKVPDTSYRINGMEVSGLSAIDITVEGLPTGARYEIRAITVSGDKTTETCLTTEPEATTGHETVRIIANKQDSDTLAVMVGNVLSKIPVKTDGGKITKIYHRRINYDPMNPIPLFAFTSGEKTHIDLFGSEAECRDFTKLAKTTIPVEKWAEEFDLDQYVYFTMVVFPGPRYQKRQR